VLYLKSCFTHVANIASMEEPTLSLGIIMGKYQDSRSQFHSKGTGHHFTELSHHLRRCCLPVRRQNTAEQEGGN